MGLIFNIVSFSPCVLDFSSENRIFLCEILESTVVINQLVLTSSQNLELNSGCFSLVSVDCSFPWGAEIVSGETMAFQATKHVPGQ